MVEVIVVDRSGIERPVNVPAGHSLMEAIRDAGIDDLLALCGGCCSCATCHVFIEGAPPGDIGPDEEDLLDSSDHRRANSRLACQLMFDGPVSGLRAIIAPED